MDSMPPTWTIAASFSGTSPKWRSARRAPTSMEVPKRVMPTLLPLSCSGLSISGRAINCCTSESRVVATIITSAPPSATLALVPPEICRNCTSPAISAFMPSTPVGVAITSTSRPYLLKMPASRAIHGGHITEESEVNAMRTLRSGACALRAGPAAASPASASSSAIRRARISLPAVKALGVGAQHFGFSRFRDVLAPANGRDHMRENAVPVGIVRGEKNFVVADPLDHVGQSFLFRLHREEPVAVLDVFARLVFAERRFDLAALLPLFVHPLHPVRHPADAAFEKRDAQLGKTLGDPAVHQAGELDERFHRPADGVHEDKTVEANLARRTLAPVVHAQRHVQTLELLVKRPEGLRAEMLLHTLGRHRDRRQTELGHGAVRLGHCRLGILQRHQRDALQARALAA